MPSYEYRASDTLGNPASGVLEADNEDAARDRLKREGMTVVELDEAGGDGLGLFAQRIRRSDIVYLTGQLAIMVETGITLSVALQGILEQERNPAMRRVLEDLKSEVEGGEDFSRALARHPKLFDKTYISMVKASEATGSLGTMMERIAGYLRKEMETIHKIRASMAYPMVMMVVALGVTIFLLTYVLPKFTPLFNRKGITLPRPTVVLMALSGAIMHYWPWWLLAATVLVLGFVFGRKTPTGRTILDWLKINFPLLGPMFRKVAISRTLRTLGTMLNSGVPMLEALQLCADVSGNGYYEAMWKKAGEDVMAGSQICQSLSGTPLLPPMVVQMISAGEQSGKLGMVLERISNYCDQDVETSLKTVTSMIEPIMIAGMGVVVGGIGMALLLPIFQLSRHPG